ncbi:MAG: hypothetical protein JWN78_1363 [Bacteroidota bacterium]|nr:hypothetical protein [Bacteroidota bacterium]
MKKLLKRVIDILGIPITIITSLWNIVITRSNERVMPVTHKLLRSFGVLPIRDHYYQPLINPQKHLKKPLDQDRYLPGINMNVEFQLDLLDKFRYQNELLSIPMNSPGELGYYYNNGRYESGDSEYLYNMIRHFKPKNVIEIGSGMSTLMAMKAIEHNKTQDPQYTCNHICIEPYEMPWLESTRVEVLRKKVEDVPIDFFKRLTDNDILFIDSSHIIRPQGDVLIEYLEILPALNKNVLVHIHDIFSPRDYPAEWLFIEHRLWNEQYLLEAYLSNNNKYEVIGALNYLKNNHFEKLSVACPILKSQPKRQPGAFWMRSIN